MASGEASLRLADKIGYGAHRLRKLQGERVDYLDVQTFERSEYNRTLQLSITFVVTNLLIACLDLALIFSFGGETGDMSGKVEPAAASSLIFTLFVGVLSMPGVFGHAILGCMTAIDIRLLTKRQHEALAKVPPFGLWFVGTFFCMSVVFGLMLLASQIGVYTIAFKCAYTLVAVAGVFLTWRMFQLRARALARLNVAHVAPLRRDQVMLRPVGILPT